MGPRPWAPGSKRRRVRSKNACICRRRRTVDFDLAFHWNNWGKGVLRLGHFTLLPDAFDLSALTLTTCNGGSRRPSGSASTRIDHGAPVSFLVSSSHGLGMTEGWAEIGDGRTNLRVTVDRATAPLLGMLAYNSDGARRQHVLPDPAFGAGTGRYRKPASYLEDGIRRFRFSGRPDSHRQSAYEARIRAPQQRKPRRAPFACKARTKEVPVAGQREARLSQRRAERVEYKAERWRAPGAPPLPNPPEKLSLRPGAGAIFAVARQRLASGGP